MSFHNGIQITQKNITDCGHRDWDGVVFKGSFEGDFSTLKRTKRAFLE